jgi:hypothetical protein
MGYPRRGVTRAGKPAGPDEFAPGAPGWTEHQYPIVELQDGRHATQVVDPDVEGDNKRLTLTELDYLRDKHSVATEEEISGVIVVAEAENTEVA